jgi:hypothetical protein
MATTPKGRVPRVVKDILYGFERDLGLTKYVVTDQNKFNGDLDKGYTFMFNSLEEATQEAGELAMSPRYRKWYVFAIRQERNFPYNAEEFKILAEVTSKRG